MKKIVKIIDWMLNHKGLAVAKIVDNSLMEIVEESENPSDFAGLKKLAKENGYYLVYGVTGGKNRLGLLIPENVSERDSDCLKSGKAVFKES